MDIRVLEYYLMVAREESITRAADLLHVTQPTLTRQLMQLEGELQVKLFTRSSHGIVLTEEGMMLKRRAQEIVDLTNQTKSDLIGGKSELNGTISIGCGEFQSVGMMADIMKAFRKEHPLVTFRIFSSNSEIIKDRIEAGLIDIGVIFDYVDIKKYEYIRFPKGEEWGVLVPSDSPLAEKETITPEDISSLPLIIAEKFLESQELEKWFGKRNDELNIISTYNLMYNAAVMVAKGMGVAGCIKLNCAYDGTKFIPAKPPVENHAVLAWKKTISQSHAVAAFIEFAVLYINQISRNRI